MTGLKTLLMINKRNNKVWFTRPIKQLNEEERNITEIKTN
jgi:hypothetical protein